MLVKRILIPQLLALSVLFACGNDCYDNDNSCGTQEQAKNINTNRLYYIGVGYSRGQILKSNGSNEEIEGANIRSSIINYYTDSVMADLTIGFDAMQNTTTKANYVDATVEAKVGIALVPQINYYIYVLGGYKAIINESPVSRGKGYGVGMSGNFLTLDNIVWFAEYKRYYLKNGENSKSNLYKFGVAGLEFKF